MAKKKNKAPSISQEDTMQARHVLEHYHQIADKLHASTDQEQANAALSEIESLPETTQIALLKALAKERHTDAADVVNTINEIGTLKSVRKEAKRALIQLQGAKIYPRWQPPLIDDRRSFGRSSLLPLDDFMYDDEYMDFDDDEEDDIDLNKLDPMAVVMNFVDNWASGDYDIAYRLLASDSPLREGLSKKEWVERRDTWADQVDPSELQPNLIQEREAEKPKLWLPRRPANNSKVIEAGWSIVLDEEALLKASSLPELPKASSVYKETGRHWFWAAYTLVQEQGAWRIQSMSDEVANLETFSVEELNILAQKSLEAVEKIQQKAPTKTIQDVMRPQLTGRKAEKMEELSVSIIIHLTRYSYYIDALIKKSAADLNLYEIVAGAMLTIGRLERGLLYLEALAQQFSEHRVQNLKVSATAKQLLSNQYFEEGYDERGERFLALARQDLNELLTIEDTVGVRISLAELYIEDERFDEAEEHLLRARTMTSDAAELAHIEMHLGDVADGQGRHEEALTHYQQETVLQPDLADSWADLAESYRRLGNLQAADDNYRHAIELEPGNGELYVALSGIYEEQGQHEKAIEVLEDGLSANPNSVALNATLATKYMLMNDYHQAKIFVDKIERIDPEFEMLPLMRASLALEKTGKTQMPRIVDAKQSVTEAGPFRLSRPKKKR